MTKCAGRSMCHSRCASEVAVGASLWLRAGMPCGMSIHGVARHSGPHHRCEVRLGDRAEQTCDCQGSRSGARAAAAARRRIGREAGGRREIGGGSHTAELS
jgi:hypothetical protein